MKYLGFSLIIATILLLIILSGPLFPFIDLPSLLGVVGITIGFTFWRYGIESFHYWKKTEIASWVGRIALHAGLFVTLIGFIIMGSSLTKPESFGMAFAIAILPLFYGYLIYLMVLPHPSIVQNRR